MRKYSVFPVIFLIILLIAGLFTVMISWLISPSTPPQKKAASHAVSEPKASVPQKESPPFLPRPKPPKKESPRPPLPREVEWSVLSNKLIEVEKQCSALITTLLPHFPPEMEELELGSPLTLESPPSTPKSPSSQTTWAQMGNQLLELEKQREQMIILFTDRGKHEVSQP